MSDIEQFSAEDNGYVICLISDRLYLLSKRGEMLKNTTVDYIKLGQYYNIIPYGHSFNEYYFVIIYLEKSTMEIVIRKYTYNSSDNEITYIGSYSYDLSNQVKEGITCELMNLESKVIACFYGEWSDSYYVVFNITDFSPISGYSGKIGGETNGGQIFVSTILPENRENALICYQHINDYKCFKYNVKDNAFSSSVSVIQEEGCQNEIVYLELEYFPETNEVLSGCKEKEVNNIFTIGKFSLNDNSFTKYTIEIPAITGCSCENSPNFFHFIYTSSGYSIIKDMGTCTNERVVSLDGTISSSKLKDYPTDEVGVLICENYYSYDGSSCIDTIEEGFYCNDTHKRTIDKCHDECISCDNGPFSGNTNCKICKDSKIVDYGNCVTSCSNDKTYSYPIDTTNLF